MNTLNPRPLTSPDERRTTPNGLPMPTGSNWPKQALAQVEAYADQAKIGFLGRNKFYNALRLAIATPSERDLTPDIVKAVLFGPSTAKVPACRHSNRTLGQ
ncbi:hypothetical protein VNO77_23350 [Canavalia gladiata]|uniref:Uncharacterized protein n=1 Tax=Canavalia gladiata TaxID=3824 RepID=A0AAN9L4A2_CANGL